MKTYILLIVFLSSASFIYCQDADSAWVLVKEQPILVNAYSYDFGIINKNDKAVFKFKFKNIDTQPLLIWHVTASCGCTLPTWTKKPIKKDKEGIVKIKYDSSKTGVFNKLVFVYTNFADKPIKLVISGTVINSKPNTKITKHNTNFDSSIPQHQ